MERTSFSSERYCPSCTESRRCSMHLSIYPPPISPTTSSRPRGGSIPSVNIVQGNNMNSNFMLSPTTESFPSYSSSPPPNFPPPVPIHSPNASTRYAPSSSITGRSFSNDSTVDMMNNGSISNHSGRSQSRSNSYFSFSGSSGYGSPEMRPFPVIPTTSMSERTATNNNYGQDPRPIFPPDEETVQKTYNLLKSTENKLQIIYSGDLSHKPDSGINLLNRKPHFILTNNNLLVYKSVQKAKSELNIPIQPGQVVTTSRFNKDRIFLASLSDIYAIHTVFSPPFSFRIDYLHPQSKQSLSYIMTAESNSEVKKWVKELRRAIRVHLLRMELINASERYNAVERISKHNDTPSKTDNILMWKVVYKEKRFIVAGDQPKEIFLPVIFAFGKFSFYILPVPGHDLEYKKYITRERYGSLSVQSIRYEDKDDTVIIELRNVDKNVSQLAFSSSFCEEIIQHLRRSIISIIPNNTVLIHDLVLPEQLKRTHIIPFHVEIDPEDEMAAPADIEVQLFNSNLRAYCASLNLNKVRFRFAIVGPNKSKSFTLLPPTEMMDYPATYTKYELLAILRAIQASAFFFEINLSNTSFLELESWKKTKEDGWTTTKGHPFNDINVLSNEIYDILTNTSLLRKLNLTNCKIGKHEEQDKASTIKAIGTIMASGKSSISRLCLGKNFVSQSDVIQLVDGIKKHKKSMKELYLNDCGLETNMIEMILEALAERSPEQMVCLDLSTPKENLVVKKDLISSFIETFKRIKVLRMRGFRLLSNSFTFNLERSHLKEIDLGNCSLSDTTINRLCRWILSPSFGAVEALHLGKCGLNGAHVYDILTSITRTQNRVMFLNLESNPIMKESMHLPKLFSAIRQSEGPAYISLAKLDWDDSTLCELFESLRDNTMFKFLDLSDIALQYSEKVSDNTVQMMTSFFERNKTVRELKLNNDLYKSGRVMTSTIKPRPVIADTITASLRGLRNNTTLEKLDLSGLGIEDPGALAFAQLLKVNKGIKSILIDENNISIDGYRKIANSIEDFAHQVVEIHIPRTDMRNQLKYLKFRIEELIVSEHEAQFFLIHTTNSERRRVKKHELQMIIQEREKCQLSSKHFDGVIQYLLNVVEKNRREKEEIFNRNMEVQLQAQVQAQELAIKQRRTNSRPNTNSFQNDTFGVGIVPESSQTNDGSSSSTTGSQSSSVISDRTNHLPNRTSAMELVKQHPSYNLNGGNIYSGSISSMSHDGHIYDIYPKSDLNKSKSSSNYSIYSDISPLKSSIYPPAPAPKNNTDIIDDPGFMNDFGYIDDLNFDLDSYLDFNQLLIDQESLANEEHVIQNLHKNIYQLA